MDQYSGNLSCEAGVITSPEEVSGERHRQAELLFSRRVDEVSRRLTERLRAVRQSHDLNWRDLLSSQRTVARLTGSDAETTPDEYWALVAHPRAAVLSANAIAVIDSEREALTDAVLRYRGSVRPVVPKEHQPLDADTTAAEIERVLSPVGALRMDRSALDEVGERWQRSLHRAALRRSTRMVLASPIGDTSTIVRATELALLDEPPWCHGDRLLAAYECAHVEVASHLHEMVLDASVAVPGRTVRHVTAT